MTQTSQLFLQPGLGQRTLRPRIVVHTTAASRVLLGPRTHSAELGVIDATVRTKSSHPIANALSEGAWRYTTRARPEVSFGR